MPTYQSFDVRYRSDREAAPGTPGHKLRWFFGSVAAESRDAALMAVGAELFASVPAAAIVAVFDRADAPATEYRVNRGAGEIVSPAAWVYDRQGTPARLVRATAPTLPGLAGKVIVSRDGAEHELSARVFGLAVTRVIPQHHDPDTSAWCPFSGVSQPDGECPVHTDPPAAA
jgi:hypothetical protein